MSLSKGDVDDDTVVTPTFRTVTKNDSFKHPNIPAPTLAVEPLSGENAGDKQIKTASKIMTSKSEEMDKKFNETGFLSI